MRKRQLTLLGSLLCVLALTACNVEVNIDGDVNANIDTSIDLGDTGENTDEGEDGDAKENVPTEISLSLNASAKEVTVGDSVDISFSTSPAGVNVTFSSSDTSVATVTNNGHVTTLAPGTVTITAVASLEGYNDVSESVVITINPVLDEGGDEGSGGTGGDDEGTGGGSGSGGEPGEEPGGEPGDEPGSTEVTTYGVEITNGASLTPLEIGDTKTVSVSLLTYTNEVETDRAIATADDVTLSSSVSGVLSINGLEITALSAGETILTATWTEKEVQSSGVSIIVNSASSEEPGTTPEAIQISFKQEVYSVEVDSTVTVDVNVSPESAAVTYTSSNTSVATINQYGVVTGVSAGSATLTATATLEGYETGTATCAINVTAKSEEEVIGAYAICGDLLNSHWNASPDTTSEYYLPYTANSNSRVWTKTITIADEDTENSDWDTYGGWVASFCIVEYGDNENEEVVAGYSAVDTKSSTGVIGGDEENDHIQVYWRNQYTLTIDLSDLSNPSIIVTCLSEYDSAYALYGFFTEASWEDTPLLTSDFALRYNSKDSSTQYWTATVTTPESTETWLAGFRIVQYGDYSTDVGTYANLASNSPVNLGEGDSGNINLNWGTTYVITIDGTSGTLSISISEYSEGGDTGDTGGDTGGGKITYDGAYALYGDFADSPWNESPDESSIYYLPYSSSEKSTMYWERTITIEDPPEDNEWWDPDDSSTWWDAGFRVVEYGSWTTVVGYSNIIGTPTGVNGTDDNDDIEVDFGSTFDLVIDCTGSSNTITVTLVSGTSGDEEEEETYTIDSHYLLYGDFADASWSTDPGYDTIYDLPYDSTNSNSKYWTRTVTMGNPSWTPGFRIVEYGSETNVAGYSNFTIDSASTGLYSEGADGSNNIRLATASTSYDLTIDMRGSTWTILINYHDDSFEAGINGKAGGSSSGGSSSGETGDALGLSDTYAMGMDTSSIVEVLAAGAVMYDYDGNKIDDIDKFMTFVASQGVNYIRIRLWLNPYDDNGNSYGGGHNDEATDLTIAKAAVKAGMKICLDFHYSDFWADRERQYCPSEWSSLSGSNLNNAAANYTTSILTDFMNAGCTPSMVQVGNETNNNSVVGVSSNTSFFVACCNAVKTFDSNIKVVIHYADDQVIDTMANYYKALVNASCQFDIIGLSFYPFWHRNGSISTFQSDMEYLKSEIPSKDICLMEYSYGFTTTWTDWGTQYGQMSNTFNDTLQAVAGYAATPEGQAQCIYDINKAVVDVGGIGSFYWESAWISKMGTCWASSYSAEFYTSHGVDVSDWNFDTCSWANQALFDYDGYVLSSFNIYNQMWGK